MPLLRRSPCPRGKWTSASSPNGSARLVRHYLAVHTPPHAGHPAIEEEVSRIWGRVSKRTLLRNAAASLLDPALVGPSPFFYAPLRNREEAFWNSAPSGVMLGLGPSRDRN